MSRTIKVEWESSSERMLKRIERAPRRVVLSLRPSGACESAATLVAEEGARVHACDVVATGTAVCVHAPISGRLARLGDEHVEIEGPAGSWVPEEKQTASPQAGGIGEYCAFLRSIGLVGMGGSRFPASVKMAACSDVDTLIINGVECEPGITVDQSVLVQEHELVRLGAETTARALGISRTVLAIQRSSHVPKQLGKLYPFEILNQPRGYPAGAEKLILERVVGRMPVAGELPFQMGCVVQNVVSLRAVGRAVRDGVPVVERPLSVICPADGIHTNLIVPVGMRILDVLTSAGVEYDSDRDIIVAGGLMMGTACSPEHAVTKGTTSLVVMSSKALNHRERSCIRCGACFNSCPLGLHPISMVERVKRGGILDSRTSAHIAECFLCGVCSAVCPARIPLVHHIAEGKRCL